MIVRTFRGVVASVLLWTDSPGAQFEAEVFNAMSGVVTSTDYVSSLHEGDWIRYNQVDFSPGHLAFQARVSCANEAAHHGQLELRLDAPNGVKIATLRVLNTGGESAWETQTAPMAAASGTHDLYLVARGNGEGSVGNLDWVKLRSDMQPRGATVPFLTHEAEVGIFDQVTLNASPDGFHRHGASGGGYVLLSATDQQVQWRASSSANRLTLRYGIPQGSNGTLAVLVNDVLHEVALGSAHCYDATAVSSKPRRYDEITIPVAVRPGDAITVRKRANDTLAWYAIDLIDLEMAPAPAARPDGFLSIADFGATADDSTDDRAAIEACITAAATGTKKVFFPAGTFRTNARIDIPANFEVRGAGLWHTTLHSPTPSTQFVHQTGFFIGSSARLSDMKLTGVSTTRASGTTPVMPNGATGFVLENLHVQNTGTLIGWSAFHQATIRNCRVIGTYFDGIHLGDGPNTNSVIENCFFRGVGDDAIAQVNRADMGLCFGNVAQFNTVIASYWGRGMANIGGDRFVIRDNVIAGCHLAGVMVATETLGPSVSRPIRDFKVQRNSIVSCGHTGHNHGGIHFFLSQNSISDVKVESCEIVGGRTKAIAIDPGGGIGTHTDAAGRTRFNYNVAAGNAGVNFSNADAADVQPVLTGNIGF